MAPSPDRLETAEKLYQDREALRERSRELDGVFNQTAGKVIAKYYQKGEQEILTLQGSILDVLWQGEPALHLVLRGATTGKYFAVAGRNFEKKVPVICTPSRGSQRLIDCGSVVAVSWADDWRVTYTLETPREVMKKLLSPEGYSHGNIVDNGELSARVESIKDPGELGEIIMYKEQLLCALAAAGGITVEGDSEFHELQEELARITGSK